MPTRPRSRRLGTPHRAVARSRSGRPSCPPAHGSPRVPCPSRRRRESGRRHRRPLRRSPAVPPPPAPWRATSRRAGRRWSALLARSGSRPTPTAGGTWATSPSTRRSTSRPARRELATSWSRRARSGAGWRGAASPSRSTSSIAPNSSRASRLADADRLERFGGLLRPPGQDVRGDARLDVDRRHRVGDAVVEVTRQLQSLLGDPAAVFVLLVAQPFLAGPHGVRGQHGDRRPAGEQQVEQRQTIPVGDDAGDHLNRGDSGSGGVAHGTGPSDGQRVQRHRSGQVHRATRVVAQRVGDECGHHDDERGQRPASAGQEGGGRHADDHERDAVGRPFAGFGLDVDGAERPGHRDDGGRHHVPPPVAPDHLDQRKEVARARRPRDVELPPTSAVEPSRGFPSPLQVRKPSDALKPSDGRAVQSSAGTAAGAAAGSAGSATS